MPAIESVCGKEWYWVDDNQYEWLSELRFTNTGGYAYYRIYRNHKIHCISMANLIMNQPIGIKIDHINGRRWDNRKCNLRICDDSQNNANRRPCSNNKSGYKGVRFNSKKGRKYVVEIRKSGKYTYLGSFACPIEAARAYDKAARELHGEFAWLNFPDESDT